MSRSIRDLLSDVRIAAAGVPGFLALHMLTMSLSEFLDRSEAWREWLPVRTVPDIVNGMVSWSNHIDDDTQRWARIKRIDRMRWHPTGAEVPFKTAMQLQEIDPDWRTRVGTRPACWTTEGEAAAIDNETVSGYQIRLYPLLAAGVDVTYGVQPRVIVVTDVVADMDQSIFDNQIPLIPDRVFYAHRQAIVAGALASLYLIPGKDWTDQKLAGVHRSAFESAITRAKSRADADYGNPSYTTGYGGI